MAITISDKQLDAIDIARRPVVVRHSRTKKRYVVMPESAYNHARPLIEVMLAEGTAPAGNGETTWTDAKNDRRASLITKKYDSELSASEAKELATLQEAVCRHQERVAPLQNHVLELIIQALEQRAKNSPPRKREAAGRSGTGLVVRTKQTHGDQHAAVAHAAVGVDPE